MAVKLEGSIRRFLGLSTDQKPLPGDKIDGATVEAKDLPVGSSFMESDTGSIYRWNGSAWTVPAGASDNAAEWLGLIYERVDRLCAIVESAAD